MEKRDFTYSQISLLSYMCILIVIISFGICKDMFAYFNFCWREAIIGSEWIWIGWLANPWFDLDFSGLRIICSLQVNQPVEYADQ